MQQLRICTEAFEAPPSYGDGTPERVANQNYIPLSMSKSVRFCSRISTCAGLTINSGDGKDIGARSYGRDKARVPALRR